MTSLSEEEGFFKIHCFSNNEEFIKISNSTSMTIGRGGKGVKESPDSFFQLPGRKQVSRKHLMIKWSPERSRFELSCLGKNGCRVDSLSVTVEDPAVGLKSLSKIKIGSTLMYFLLPEVPTARD
eukprot:71669_1